jgi:hypothetical protein
MPLHTGEMRNVRYVLDPTPEMAIYMRTCEFTLARSFFRCSACRKPIIANGYLQRHLQTRTDAKSFECVFLGSYLCKIFGRTLLVVPRVCDPLQNILIALLPLSGIVWPLARIRDAPSRIRIRTWFHPGSRSVHSLFSFL